LILTFENGQFVLQTPTPALTKPEGFVRNGSHKFSTKDLKAAARFRCHADSKAEKIFKKLMLQTVALPPRVGPTPEDLTLYPFQLERGVPHILGRNKSYLAHQPGLGKTAQAICAVNSKIGRTFVVCPSFLKTTWAREITKWFLRDFPSIEIVPETERAFSTNWSADFVIVSDSMIAKEWVRLGLLGQRFRYGFIDEAHRFKTPGASRTVALFGGNNGQVKSPGLIYSSEHVCCLSGTPLLNRPIELWPMLYAMAPELIDFMSFEDFGFRYGGAVLDDRGHWRFVGSANEFILRQKIMPAFMQRITKKDVLKELPDKIREVIIVDDGNRSKDAEAFDKELLRKLRATKFEKPSELGEYARLRHLNGMAKVDWIVAFVNNVLTSDVEEQMILYAHHRDVAQAFNVALSAWGPRLIVGGTSLEERTRIEDAFQAGKCRLIIGNIDAMNLGLTLTAATRVGFAEYAWTPAANEQAEDRAHRIGQKDSVLCQYFVLPNSIDEALLYSVMTKEESIGRLLE
jgi:SWI/SNF-related matrix-associated actin-dependent regulator 1 of chromatin subfamily A